MRYQLKKLIGMEINAIDDAIGRITDVYFDDKLWVLRYLVVRMGHALGGRAILLSPFAVSGIDWQLSQVQVRLGIDEVKNSPDIDTDKPISRQHEMELFNYYGYVDYWNGGQLWGNWPLPMPSPGDVLKPVDDEVQPIQVHFDPHLRSAEALMGCHVHAPDGSIGHIENVIVDLRSWQIRYIVVNTHNWIPGKHVVIPPRWLHEMDWKSKNVRIDCHRQAVQEAPIFDPEASMSKVWERSLYDYFARVSSQRSTGRS